MSWLNGKLSAMEPQAQVEFVRQQSATYRRIATVLMFSIPALFMLGWTRDLAMLGERAFSTLPYRLTISACVLAVALVLRLRILKDESVPQVALVGLSVLGAGVAITVVMEPARLSMAHVVYMLIMVQAIPLALRNTQLAGAVAALWLPMCGLLYYMGASTGLWLAYSLYLLIGLCFGLYLRRNRLDIAVDLFNLRRQLQERALADTLTGMLNRDGWLTHGHARYRRSLDQGERLSLMYLDLDHFKQVNDQHGHAVGDGVLEAVADTVRQHLRAEDIVARLGGEEFVALLPGITAERAHVVAERIRHAVQGLDGPVSVTISVGVHEARAGESLEHAMQRADQAMLQAKREGRNRVLTAV